MSMVHLTVNGSAVSREIDDFMLLVEFLREELGLTGTHVGCDTTQCGCCVVHLNGVSAKSCTVLALQAEGAKVTTIEGLAKDGELHPLQRAFREHHGLQCGFCTPGMLTTLTEFLAHNPDPSESEIRVAISGNLCRCTGYQSIVAAALQAARVVREGRS